jgi:hypothetical protein
MRALFLLLPAMVVWSLFRAAIAGGDITPPVLTDATADRLQIDTSQAAQTITFTMHITDDLAGLSHVHIEMRHQLGYNAARMCQASIAPAVTDTVVQCGVTWPRYSADGVWMVSWFTLTDGVGNVNDGNMVDCAVWADGRCSLYEYNEQATAVIRAMEIQIGGVVAAPPVYLPLIVASP